MSDLVEAGRYLDLPSAVVAKSHLESLGMLVFCPDYQFGAINWHMLYALGGFRLMVRAEDAEAARRFLGTQVEPGWERCPACDADAIYRRKSRGWVVLSVLILALYSVPTAFVKTTRGRLCKDCSHRWTAGDDA